MAGAGAVVCLVSARCFSHKPPYQEYLVEGELDKESNLHILQIVNADRPVVFYSLDVMNGEVR